MAAYYAKTPVYYDNINFAVSNWDKKNELSYQRILECCQNKRVAEVGCGQAAMLNSIDLANVKYTGCDFSKDLIANNQRKYSSAVFKVIDSPTQLPLETASYDVIFCVFVLEHVVQPKLFLRELVRCCAVGGRVIIMCPDFAGRSGISSQIVGFSNGSGWEKIKSGRVLDGLLTGAINKVLMPIYFKYKLRNASRHPVFMLNEEPACFCRDFYPDADAVYVTHRGEIVNVLQNLGCEPLENDEAMCDYLKRGRNMFVEVIKHK